MTSTKWTVTHPSGIQVEVVSLANPHWPEVRFTGPNDLIQGIAAVMYPADTSDDPNELGLIEYTGTGDDDPVIFTTDFVAEPWPLTVPNVLVEVLQWLDELPGLQAD